MFEVNGQMVNHAGQPVDEQGKVLVAEQPRQPNASEVDGLKRQLDSLKAEVHTQAGIIEHGSADNKRLIGEAGSSNENSFRLKGELDSAQAQIQQLTAQAQSQDTALAERVAEVDTLKARISELEAQLASQGDGENAKPGDVDQRTKAQLKEALDAKSVTYAPNTNRDGLLALAAEHQV